MPGEPGFILTHCAIDGYSPRVVEEIENIFKYVKLNDRENLNNALSKLSD
jgi:hypothetical protein